MSNNNSTPPPPPNAPVINFTPGHETLTISQILHNYAEFLVTESINIEEAAKKKEQGEDYVNPEHTNEYITRVQNYMQKTEKVLALGAKLLFDYISNKVITQKLDIHGLKKDVDDLMMTINNRYKPEPFVPMTEEFPPENEVN